MSDQNDLPPFEIVSVENASSAVAKRLRVYVVINPKDVDQTGRVAHAVISEHGADNDVVTMFFHFSAASAGHDPAVARAQYVRNGMKQGYVPKALTGDRETFEVETLHGVITVEKARQA